MNYGNKKYSYIYQIDLFFLSDKNTLISSYKEDSK